ncbi:unnamed protein product [Adineta ricciae]|uniref:TIR domain-containing protein n=1 Tax=Adineta ricciae TaxID=249248 RepID=A0A814IKI2_ADIRI|nr:unnamed protein product [Adineta ricciae]CAF1024692.1 unnamed protein product [Adineta ricciae]
MYQDTMQKSVGLNRPITSSNAIIAGHCATIRNTKISLDAQTLSNILNDVVRELKASTSFSASYLNSLNAVVLSLRSTLPPALLSLNSHYFFVLVRDAIQVLLQHLCTKYHLNQPATYLLRNCVVLLKYLVKNTKDVSKLLHWITNLTFIDTIANCLDQIERIAKLSSHRLFIKQIARLLKMFNDIQARLPIEQHNSLFSRLLKPVIKCLKSPLYVETFNGLKLNSKLTKPFEKLLLVKCPQFLETYNGPHMGETVEEVLELILPRYVSILDTHITSITTWTSSVKRAVYHLLKILVYAEDYFTLYLNDQLLEKLTNHLLRIVSEPTLTKSITQTSNNLQSLIIHATLEVFDVLIHEVKALNYLKRSKAAETFEKLLSSPKASITSKSYDMLAYTLNINDVKEAREYFPRFTCNVLNLLYEAVESNHPANNDSDYVQRSVLQFAETLAGLVRYEQVKQELIKQSAVPFLVKSSEKLTGSAKQFVLDAIWTLSFDEKIAQQLRDDSQFIESLQNITKPTNNSFENGSNETAEDGIYKTAIGLLWTLRKEPQVTQDASKTAPPSNKFDVAISYSIKDKDVVNRLEETLINEGYAVWIDRDILHRQSMESVSEAMNKSTVVIVCLSEWYVRDNQCVCESVYAVNSKRVVVPLIVEKGYVVNSWLLSMLNKSGIIEYDVNDLKRNNELVMKEISQHCRNKGSKVKINTPTPNSVLNGNKENTFARIIPTPVLSGRVSAGSDRQQQQENASRSNSRQTVSSTRPTSTTPVSRMTSSSTTPTSRTPLSATPTFVNANYEKFLPQDYTKRDTSDATYHSMPINAWKKKEILDFLYDCNLILMMPLCDTMTGRSLVGFFRMCQADPSRVYGQLSDELRSRYRGLTLPIGVYSQFLIEMDNLMSSQANHTQILPFSSMNNKYQSTPMPVSTDQSQYPLPLQARSSSSFSNTPKPLEIIPEAQISYNERVAHRATFRPGSAADHPYNFSSEADEQSKLVFEQLARYENQVYAPQQRAYDY